MQKVKSQLTQHVKDHEAKMAKKFGKDTNSDVKVEGVDLPKDRLQEEQVITT